MAIERTLSIIKPDAVARNVIGQIYQRFEDAGLSIVCAQMLHLNYQQAEAFFQKHKEKPYYFDLLEYMTSGPVMVQVLEGESAISANRSLMGASDVRRATVGTIRKDFAESRRENAIYGSYSAEEAKAEILFFFQPQQMCLWTR